MTKRHQNNGLRKLCRCPRRQWSKCRHAWHLNFKPAGGPSYRISLDRELGRHIDSKTEVAREAARIKADILAGRFGQPTARDEMTLRQLADTYLERYVAVERASTADAYRWNLGTICRTVVPHPTAGGVSLGDWRLTDIVTDTIERFREVRRQKTGVVGVNRNLGSLRALFNWGIRVGYVETSPFKRGTEPAVTLSQEHPRSRRLPADEEAQLMAVCGWHLRPVVEAALETGMRDGEISSLQWTQVEGLTLKGSAMTWAEQASLMLPFGKTKTRRDRRIPISSRLRAILEMRRRDPTGRPIPMESYVFGNAIGEQVKSHKRAWATAVLRAHGQEVAYTATGNLTAASRESVSAIDLHFHDLHREAALGGSREVFHCTRFGIGSATPTSRRRAPISRAQRRRSTTPCDDSRSGGPPCNRLQRMSDQGAKTDTVGCGAG